MSNLLRLALLLVLFLSFDVIAQSRIKVGLIYPASGPLSFYGLEVANGLKLLPEALQKRFEFQQCDDGGNPDKAKQCAVTLADREKVSAVIGPVFSPSDAAVRGLLGERKIVQFSLAGLGSAAERPATYFRLRQNDGEITTYAASFVAQTLKARKLTIIATPGLLTRGKSWADIFPGAEIRVLQLSGTAQSDLDKAATDAANDSSEVVFFAHARPSAQAIEPSTQAMGLAKMLGTKKLVASVPQRADIAMPGVSNLFLVGLGAPASVEGKSFDNAYRNMFRTLPATYLSYYAHAAVEVLATVYSRRRPEEVPDVTKLIETTTFSTVAGKLAFERASGEALSVIAKDVVGFPAAAKGIVLAQSTGATPCNCSMRECCNKNCCKGKTPSCTGDCTETSVVGAIPSLASLAAATEVCHGNE